MRVTVLFHRLAAREYRKAFNWYAERSEAAAERFRLAVKTAVDRIASEGEALPVLSGQYR
jgi:plasmid stabilization system protein ParE